MILFFLSPKLLIFPTLILLTSMLRSPWGQKRKEEREKMTFPSLSKSRGLIREALKIIPRILLPFQEQGPHKGSPKIQFLEFPSPFRSRGLIREALKIILRIFPSHPPHLDSQISEGRKLDTEISSFLSPLGRPWGRGSTENYL